MPSIDARITKVEQDASTGWFRITTDHDRIGRLDTKRENLGEEAAQLMREGVLARIEFAERESTNVNPHTNRPYMNRHYESGVALGEKPVAPGIEVIGQTNRRTDPADAWRMCLNKGGELAVLTLPMMPTAQRSFEVQKQIAVAWAEFFFFTALPSQPSFVANGSSFLAPASARSEPAYSGSHGDPGPQHDPDDIPF